MFQQFVDTHTHHAIFSDSIREGGQIYAVLILSVCKKL
jgi:hypothetical protein